MAAAPSTTTETLPYFLISGPCYLPAPEIPGARTRGAAQRAKILRWQSKYSATSAEVTRRPAVEEEWGKAWEAATRRDPPGAFPQAT